jgi:hypothetical protein
MYVSLEQSSKSSLVLFFKEKKNTDLSQDTEKNDDIMLWYYGYELMMISKCPQKTFDSGLLKRYVSHFFLIHNNRGEFDIVQIWSKKMMT